MTLALLAASMLLQTAGTPAQPAPPTPAPAATDAGDQLTEAEQKTMKRCKAMAPGQAAQSSKCSAVMTKAGQVDPAKVRASVPQ